MLSTPLDVAHDVAELPALGARHAQAPVRLGEQVRDGRQRGLDRHRQAVLQVLVALRQDLQVQRQHQRRAFGGLGPLDQALDEGAVAHHIELEPERVGAVGRHVLDRADAHRRQGERHAELAGRARRQDLAVGPLHAGRAHGCQRHRHGHVLAHQLGAGGAVVHVDGHSLSELDLLEVVFVRPVRALGPGAGVDIVVEHARHALVREHAQVFDVGDDGHEGSPADGFLAS
jgi:hypothetical protein